MRSLLPQILQSEESDLLRATLAEYLDEALSADEVRRLDQQGAFPRDVWEGLAGLGVLGLGIPEAQGGSGGSAAHAVIACSEIARRYPSLAVDYVLCGMVGRMLGDHGTDAQREAWLRPLADGTAIMAYGITEPDGGTDALAARTTASRSDDGWVINGRKLWISMADHAEVIFTVARTSEPPPGRSRANGLSVLAVPTDQPGVQVDRVHLAGMRGAGTCEVLLEDAVVPDGALVGPEGRGFHMLRETLNVERLLSAGISIGIGTAALDFALTYATEREAFGRPIGGFQSLQHGLVDASVGLAGALLLTERAVDGYEAGDDVTDLAGMAKLATAEATAVVVDRGMRLMGAMGLAQEAPMQMWFRDARLQLFSPVSNEMIRNLLGEAMGLPRSY